MVAPLLVRPIACLSDNYAYLVHRKGETTALVVDPSEAEPVTEAATKLGLEIRAVLATHHHFDHVGGNLDLKKAIPNLEIIASAHDESRVPGCTRTVVDRETFTVIGLEVRTISVPGHTLGAVAFHIDDAVFTGDTLFVAGCGRLFEGTPAMMLESLAVRLAELPPETRVYCGHEYTRSNAAFARTIEPDNAAVTRLLARATEAEAAKRPTVPSTIGDEMSFNPFMRARLPALAARFGGGDPVAALGAIRKMKDEFRG